MHKMYLTGIRKKYQDTKKQNTGGQTLRPTYRDILDHQNDNRNIVMFVSLQSPPRTKLDSFKYLILSN